jgi:hypothetical protein
MSARSFAHSSFVLVLAVTACGSKKPEADPAKVQVLAKTMATAAVPFAGLRACAPADFQQPSMSQPTLLRLAGEEVPTTAERVGWMNPPELDAPYARTLVESTDEKQRRQAAAEFLAAKQYIVFRVDLLDVPLALEFKELKRGAVGIRAIGFDRAGEPVCVKQFTVQNDKEKSEWAMKTSNKAVVDPAVAQVLRDDLKVQLLAKLEQLRTAP